MTNRPDRPARKTTLVAIVGMVTATLLLTNVPLEESGRKVKVDIAVDGTAHVSHVAGPQYLQAYLDIAGVATACDGLTRVNGRPIRMGDRFTPGQCAEMLEHELALHAQGVMACTPGLTLARPHRDHVRFAAISLAYNIGVAGWCGSTARRKIDAGQIRAGCDAFLMWNKARNRGKLRPVEGLTKRRQRERAACLRDA